MDKGAIFIDGGYLNRILKEKFKGMASINYLGLCDELCKKVQVERLRTYYYTCAPIVRPQCKEDRKRMAAAQEFMSYIKRLPRFEIRLGKLQCINGQFRQKMVDVLLSLDLVNMCYEKQVQQVILIAGDSDFVPAIKKAKDCGAVVHTFYHPSAVHNNLLDEVDEAHELTQELIDKVKL